MLNDKYCLCTLLINMIRYRNSSLLGVHWDTIWEEETFAGLFVDFFMGKNALNKIYLENTTMVRGNCLYIVNHALNKH